MTPTDSAKDASKAYAALLKIEAKRRADNEKHDAKRVSVLANLPPLTHKLVMAMIEHQDPAEEAAE